MVPILAAVFYVAASLAAAEEPSPNLHCSDLSPELVCLVGGSGFSYNDGCNGIKCGADGRATTTLMACRTPHTDEERSKCDRHTRKIWRRMGPFTCPNVDPTAVCPSRGAGFAYSDGCNRVRCLEGGGFASTRMACPVTNPEGPFCKLVAASLAESASTEARSGPLVEDSQPLQQWECPNLHFSKVCAEYLPSFTYNDGCRKVKCLADGLARLPPTSRDCPEPEASNAAAVAYCEAAERRMLDKKARSSFYTTCLQADTVCKASRTAELAFHDGCNRCYCLQDRSAACTRVACPPRFQTPEEFAEHCKRVGAGNQIPQK